MVGIHSRKFSRALKCSHSVMQIKTQDMLLVCISATFLQDSVVSQLRVAAAPEPLSNVWNNKRCLCSLNSIVNPKDLESLTDAFCCAELFCTTSKPLQEGNCVWEKSCWEILKKELHTLTCASKIPLRHCLQTFSECDANWRSFQSSVVEELMWLFH